MPGKDLISSILHEPTLLFPNPEHAKAPIMLKLIDESNINYLRGLRCEDAVKKTLSSDPSCVKNLQLFNLPKGGESELEIKNDNLDRLFSSGNGLDLTDAVISRIIDDVDPLCGHPLRRDIQAISRQIADSREVAVSMPGLLPLSKLAVSVFSATLEEVPIKDLDELMNKYNGRFGYLTQDGAPEMLCRAVAEGCGIKPGTIHSIADLFNFPFSSFPQFPPPSIFSFLGCI